MNGQDRPPEILQYFAYEHLPHVTLRAASQPFHDLAHEIAKNYPNCAEKTAGLRKLLEAKDCIVRAAMTGQP